MKAVLLTEISDPNAPIGGKAQHIRWLLNHGKRVPTTWVLPAGAGGQGHLDVITWLSHDGPWAVRSSAAVEDGMESSYAGQFATFLDVSGSEEVAQAIRGVQASAQSSIAGTYRKRKGDSQPVAMAVIVQEMVPPVVSGVAFSRNPMTGLNEVVIESVRGRGDALVGEGVTPERWIERWGGWSERPTEEGALPEPVARTIAAETKRIAGEFDSPVDLEWVWDGIEVWWVQLRPITGLDDVTVYSNRISREVMPGMIKPLVWSVNVPIVNRAWIELFGELIGPNDLRPEQLAKQFAYRSYFNMGTIGEIFELLGMPRDGLEMLLGLPSDSKPSFRPSLSTMRHVPRMLATLAGKARYGRRLQPEVAELQASYAVLAATQLESLSDTGLLSHIDDLSAVTTTAAYANIVTPLLANAYAAMLRRAVARGGVDADAVDLELGDPANPYNPNPALDRLGSRIAGRGEETVAAIKTHGQEALPGDLAGELAGFLDRFGHLSDSGNDFSVPPWSEQPDAVLRLAVDHAEVTGKHRPRPWWEATAEMKVLSRRRLQFLQRKAGEFVDHREQVSFVYTFGYGLFRPTFLEVGRRLVERGLIGDPEDVMFLSLDEVRDALLNGASATAPAEVVDLRKAEMVDLTDVDMPEIIFGDDFFPARPVLLEAVHLRGVATSRGRHRGTLRVVNGIEDSPRVEAGDIIAIPFSDVGWTPLFARAGAVIAEAGGMLSHSSIVAREYRVPCVVSVPGATRLPDGATVVVDGYTGTITVEDTNEATGEPG
ncbi:MAG: PEP/pyruvate-binding domain-containing protein [Acidimicrobiia bacterium]